MALGDNAFEDLGSDLAQLMGIHGETVTVTRTTVPVSDLDAFGEPSQTYTPLTFQTTIIPADTKLVEAATVGGGKHNEVLTFVVPHGTIEENDEIMYNGHTYHVTTINSSTIGGLDIADEGTGYREVA